MLGRLGTIGLLKDLFFREGYQYDFVFDGDLRDATWRSSSLSLEAMSLQFCFVGRAAYCLVLNLGVDYSISAVTMSARRFAKKGRLGIEN